MENLAPGPEFVAIPVVIGPKCQSFNFFELICNQINYLQWQKLNEDIINRTLLSVFHQSLTSRVNCSKGFGYGIGITDLASILIPPKPSAALCINVDGKYVKVPIWTFICILYVHWLFGGIGQFVPTTPSCHELFLCFTPFLLSIHTLTFIHWQLQNEFTQSDRLTFLSPDV